MKIISKLLIAYLSMIVINAHAASYEKVVTTGQGETLDAAIDIALRRAVEQVSHTSTRFPFRCFVKCITNIVDFDTIA